MAAITKAWVKNTSRIAADGVVAIASSLDDMGLPFVEYDYCFRLL